MKISIFSLRPHLCLIMYSSYLLLHCNDHYIILYCIYNLYAFENKCIIHNTTVIDSYSCINIVLTKIIKLKKNIYFYGLMDFIQYR